MKSPQLLMLQLPEQFLLSKFLYSAELPKKSPVCHREVEIPAESSKDGKMIRDLNLPEDCVLVKIIRDHEIISHLRRQKTPYLHFCQKYHQL